MVRMDLVASLKNALDRGYTLEQAKQSLINSGYGSGEIDTAANYLTGGFGTTPQTIAQTFQQEPNYPGQDQPISEQDQIKQAVNPAEMQQFQQPNQPQSFPAQQHPAHEQLKKPEKPFPWTLVLLLIVLFVLIGGLVGVVIFREAIIEFFQTL